MEEELKKLGLNEHEARIYLASLSMGMASAGNLADRTGIKRSTTYLALDNLVKKGLASEVYQNKKRLFKAEKPDKLEKLTRRMRRQVIQAEILLESVLPALKNISKSSITEPRVSVLEGINGIKNVLLDISASPASWYMFGSSTLVLQSLPAPDLREILEEGDEVRRKSGSPKIYFLTDDGILKLKEFQKHLPDLREIKILPKTINANSALILLENKLVILYFGEKPHAIVIENKEIVHIVKILYQLAWAGLK